MAIQMWAAALYDEQKREEKGGVFPVFCVCGCGGLVHTKAACVRRCLLYLFISTRLA